MPGPEAFQAGGEMVVVGPGASLMRGENLQTVVPAGEHLPILKVQGPWIGTSVTRNGKRVTGWVYFETVVPVQPADRANAPAPAPQSTEQPDQQMPAQP